MKHRATGATGIETLPHIDSMRRCMQSCCPSSFVWGSSSYYRYSGASGTSGGIFDDTDFMFDGDMDAHTIEFNNW